MNKTVEEIRGILEVQQSRASSEISREGRWHFWLLFKGGAERNQRCGYLVELKKPIGLIEFVSLKNYLSDLLGVNVDLVMKKALKPRIGRRILGEVLYV